MCPESEWERVVLADNLEDIGLLFSECPEGLHADLAVAGSIPAGAHRARRSSEVEHQDSVSQASCRRTALNLHGPAPVLQLEPRRKGRRRPSTAASSNGRTRAFEALCASSILAAALLLLPGCEESQPAVAEQLPKAEERAALFEEYCWQRATGTGGWRGRNGEYEWACLWARCYGPLKDAPKEVPLPSEQRFKVEVEQK